MSGLEKAVEREKEREIYGWLTVVSQRHERTLPPFPVEFVEAGQVRFGWRVNNAYLIRMMPQIESNRTLALSFVT